MNTTLKTIASFTIGAAAGLLAGYLTAPNSGKKTRKKIVNELDKSKNALEEAASQKLNEAKDLLSETVNSQLRKGKVVVDKTKDAILN